MNKHLKSFVLYFIFVAASISVSAQWATLPNSFPGFDNSIRAITTDGSNFVYAAGDFKSSNLGVQYTVNKFSYGAWLELGNFNDKIKCLTRDFNNNIYAAGDFTDGTNQYVAVYDHFYGGWSKLCQFSAFTFNGSINCLTSDGNGNIYAAGNFTNAAGNNFVAKWDKQSNTWSQLGNDFNGPINSISLRSIGGFGSILGNNPIVGGEFFDGNNNRYIAEWDGNMWNELFDNASGRSPFNNNIKNVYADKSGNVYASGDFTNGMGKYYVAKFENQNWNEVGIASGNNTFNGKITSSTIDDQGNVYATGEFTDGLHYYIAKYDGNFWSNEYSINLSTPVYSIFAGFNGYIYAGGDIKDQNGERCIANFTPFNQQFTWTSAFTNYWRWGVADWNIPANWSNNTVPGVFDKVTIAAGTLNSPTLTNSLIIGEMQLDGNLIANGQALTLTGLITGNGAISVDQQSYLTIDGNVGTLNFDFFGLFRHQIGYLTINSGSATLGSRLDVTETFTPTGGVFNTGDNLYLRRTDRPLTDSYCPGEAIVGYAGGTVNGKVTVETMLHKAYRAYSDIAPGVINAGSIFDNWQEKGSYYNFNNQGVGCGIFITGKAQNRVDNGFDPATGIDYTTLGNPSGAYYDYRDVANGYWPWITNTKTTMLNPYRGYRLLLRGSRLTNLYTVNPAPAALGLLMFDDASLRATGNLVIGDVSYTKNGIQDNMGNAYNNSNYGLNPTIGGFTSVANPYICPVDFNSVYGNHSSDISNNYWYFSSALGAVGAYVAYNTITGSTSGTIDYRYLQPNQAFFIQTTGNNPGLKFTENDKVVDHSKLQNLFGTATPLNRILTSLAKKQASDSIFRKMDAASVVFNPLFSNGNSKEDAIKINNSSDNLGIYHNGVMFCIDGRPLPTANDTVAITLSQLSNNMNYQLSIDATTYQSGVATAYLYDAYKHTFLQLVDSVNTISFGIDTAITSSYLHRFNIIFKPILLPVNVCTLHASTTNATVKLNWENQSKSAVDHFEIERLTTSGDVFEKIANSDVNFYQDVHPAEGINSYRIKVVGKDGIGYYSNTINITVQTNEGISIYPNPIKDFHFTLKMAAIAKGNYDLNIYNSLGQKIIGKRIVHEGGSANYSINLPNHLAEGAYEIMVKQADNNIYQSTITITK